MLAAAAGLIFWRYDRNSSLLLDTSTMAFSIVPLPVTITTHTMMPPGAYAIGDTEAGVCCLLLMVGRTTLQVWLLKKKDGGGGHAWELEKQSHIGWLDSFNRRFGVHMVAAGLAIVYCMSCKFSHFVIDLKDLSLMDKFRCHRTMAYTLSKCHGHLLRWCLLLRVIDPPHPKHMLAEMLKINTKHPLLVGSARAMMKWSHVFS
ncbi:hypothetical protein VPH35_006349 [Triticum aestivum]|uniref:uncharacterized protein n=1 Tax=Triticum aestivum TaxID=4565 RepID=UPI001D00699B|nr:uncharacterized protein LOC123086164 [Triticum aestivum]XP_044363841.1 uncharacterized protein LOC123086183 [Triticum aestivum]